MEDLLADDSLLDGLLDSGESEGLDLFEHKHLPPPSKESPDKVAKGTKCEDFDQFEQGFIDCHADLRSGRRQLKQFSNPSNIKKGFFYVQRGMLVYVAAIGELTQKSPGQDGRTRCIYENGTESDLLLQSLARGLYDDGKIVTEPSDTYVEKFETPDHIKLGHVYVARSNPPSSALEEVPNLHKIGFTTQSVEARLSGAASDPTFLMAPATPVASYEMPADYAKLVETLLHQFFSEVRLEVWYEVHEKTVDATEWFSVPAEAIDEAIDLIQSSQLGNYRYVPATHTIELA